MSQAHELPLRVAADLNAEAISCDGGILVFRAPKAFPPGKPIELTLLPGSEQALSLQARSIGSKLQPDQRFEVRARLVNLSRDARLKLQAVFGG